MMRIHISAWNDAKHYIELKLIVYQSFLNHFMLTSWNEVKAKHYVSFANWRLNRKTESDTWTLFANVFQLQDE